MLTFFGFMHGPSVGFAVKPVLALAYMLVAGLLLAVARGAVSLPVLTRQADPHVRAPAE